MLLINRFNIFHTLQDFDYVRRLTGKVLANPHTREIIWNKSLCVQRLNKISEYVVFVLSVCLYGQSMTKGCANRRPRVKRNQTPRF